MRTPNIRNNILPITIKFHVEKEVVILFVCQLILNNNIPVRKTEIINGLSQKLKLKGVDYIINLGKKKFSEDVINQAKSLVDNLFK